MKTMSMVFCVFLISAAVAAAGELPTTESILDRFIAAVGGKEALQKAETRCCSGTIIQDLTWTDPTHQETPFVVRADADGEIRYAESTDWAALEDTTAADLRSKLQWLFHPQYALVVQDYFPALEVVEVKERDGRQVAVLCSPDQDFSYFALYFDRETGLLNHIGYHNEVLDYQDAGGVLYPNRVIFGRKGGHTTYVLDTVMVNSTK